MPFLVVLEGEDRDRIDYVCEPTTYLIHPLFPAWDDPNSRTLRFIDDYGDIVFNRLQMNAFLEEWKPLRDRTTDPELREFIDRVSAFAERSLAEPHLYIRFIGD